MTDPLFAEAVKEKRTLKYVRGPRMTKWHLRWAGDAFALCGQVGLNEETDPGILEPGDVCQRCDRVWDRDFATPSPESEEA